MKNKTKKTILILCFLITIIGTMFITLAGDATRMLVYVDWPSLLFIILPTVVMLLFSDLMGDYIRGYKIAWGNVEFTNKELKASAEALSLSIKLVLLTGIGGIIIGVISSLVQIRAVNEIYLYFAMIAVILLTGLYAVLINLIQYSVLAKINKEIIYREN